MDGKLGGFKIAGGGLEGLKAGEEDGVAFFKKKGGWFNLVVGFCMRHVFFKCC